MISLNDSPQVADSCVPPCHQGSRVDTQPAQKRSRLLTRGLGRETVDALHLGLGQPQVHGAGGLGGVLRPRGAGDGDDGVAVVRHEPRQGDLGGRGPVRRGDVAELRDQRRRALQPLRREIPAGRRQA